MSRFLYAAAVTAMFVGSSAGAVTIDFEEFAPDVAINPPSGDATSKNFLLDYLDEGLAGNPVIISAGSSPNGTQGYINCPTCLPVEQIDVSHVSGYTFDLSSMQVAAVSGINNYDFIFTGFLQGGGTVSQSVLDVFSLQTVNFGSGWSNLSSFRIEIDNTGNTNLFGASFIDNIVITNVVPIPAAVWLFGSALMGLGWLRRRAA